MDAEKASGQGGTLLIVEDDMLPAMALRDELEDAGYHVLDLTRRHQEGLDAAQASKVDLALVNIELQGRDDGIALARELQKLGVPSLFISGQTTRAKSAQSAAIASLPKPYSPADVVKAVAYLLGRLKGDPSLSCPPGLEVFGPAPDTATPEAA
ncbi:response regulator [Phenylobacterium sp. LjRoot225]|uniref:response regulator n=1 Tax=Phenylobacterium sp. LjRoot225 TaxID=3342285 RepID=UPI003ED162C6